MCAFNLHAAILERLIKHLKVIHKIALKFENLTHFEVYQLKLYKSYPPCINFVYNFQGITSILYAAAALMMGQGVPPNIVCFTCAHIQRHMVSEREFLTLLYRRCFLLG